MIFFNKKSFFAPFFTVFFGVMVILGSTQALVGTLRWYNPSEEEHEKLATAQTYTATKTPEKPTYVSLFLSRQEQEDLGTYFSDNRDDIQNALQTVPADKAQKIVVRIQQSTQDINTPVPQIPIPISTPQTFQSPVRLQVQPTSATIPSGYSAAINTVVT